MLFWKILIEIVSLQAFIKQIRNKKYIGKANYVTITHILHLCFSGAKLLPPDVRQLKLPDVAPVETSYFVQVELLCPHSVLDV